MSQLAIFPATAAHIRDLFPRLRPGDRRELDLVAGNDDPLNVMLAGLERSIEASTAVVDGKIAAMWGVIAMTALDACGCPWLLTSPVVERNRKLFLKTAIAEVRAMRSRWAVLAWCVDPTYTGAVRLLGRLGFAMAGASAYPGLSMFVDETAL